MFYVVGKIDLNMAKKHSERSIVNLTQNIIWPNAQSAKYLKHKLQGQGKMLIKTFNGFIE